MKLGAELIGTGIIIILQQFSYFVVDSVATAVCVSGYVDVYVVNQSLYISVLI